MKKCKRCQSTKIEEKVIKKPNKAITEVFCRTCGHKIERLMK